MEIIIKCPVCNASNNLNENEKICRRCKNDLSLLFLVKLFSYKYRIIFAQLLLSDNIEEAKENLQKATDLCKEI